MFGKEDVTVDMAEIYCNYESDEVILLDISSNKQWMARVVYNSESEDNSQSDGNEKKAFLTLCKFTATNNVTGIEELGYNGNQVEKTDRGSRKNITEFLKRKIPSHCKFLSVSNDGKYVALSFLIINLDGNRSKNPNCLIFEVEGNSFKLAFKMKCQGRAVFLNRKGSTLAIISKNTMEVYTEFPKNRTATYVFQLSSFYSNATRTCESVYVQNTYIDNTSWLNISSVSNVDANVESIITFTRHIRHNLLTTPFKGGVIRIWSILEDGARLASFPALNQHVMAFSKNYKYAAAYVENSRSINIYNVKSGLLVYRLKPRDNINAKLFKISHIRFCYDARYVAMSGLEGNDQGYDSVVFEVWYVETERSIYKAVEKIINQVHKDEPIANLRRVEPFVRRGKKDNQKCLKGYYTSYPEGKMTIMCVELDIDRTSKDDTVNWKTIIGNNICNKDEIENGLQDFSNLRCGDIKIGKENYLIRFGKHTVQLWHINLKRSESSLITEDDKLLYIRAYKGPDYGLEYCFRETWEICGYDSIRYIGGNLSGRLIVNIKRPEDLNVEMYHTEEIFLPLYELLPPASSESEEATGNSRETLFDYHKLESACQALHYLFMGEYCRDSTTKNLDLLRKKTNEIIKLAVSNIKTDSNFFSTIAGSRTLAMLASFEDGRKVIRLIMGRKVPISIFGYARTRPEKNQKEGLNKNISNTITTAIDSNMPDLSLNKLLYRSSPPKKISESTHDTKMIASKENVLTVLIDELSHDLYTLIFNCILVDSKKLGPGCLSSLTDALLYLQGRRNYKLLLSSSAKLSYLAVEKTKLGILQHESEEMDAAKVLEKKHISDTENLEAHATMEEIKMYKGFWLLVYFSCENFLQWSNLDATFRHLKNKYNRICWRRVSLEDNKELDKLSSVCVVPITHFNSYNNLPEDRPNSNYSDDGPGEYQPYRKESAFVRVALDQHISDMFQQGDIVLELLLKYKWQHFARSKFILICFIHAIYYVSYCTGVLFAPELYGHNLENTFTLENPSQIASIVLMLASLLILVIQEARQFYQKNDKLNYFFSGYNWIDISAFVLPIFTLIQLYCNWPQFVEVCSVSTLILWTHAILRLRVISHFGITLETIIQLSKKVAPVLLIMLLVILAFTQSYIVLLRLHPDDYFRDTFTGTFLSANGSEGLDGAVEYATSTNNGFVNWFVAFYNVWLFIYGVWDPIVQGDAGSSKMVMVMSIVFSLIAVLIFFNMVIAIMSSAVEEVDSRGKKVWVSHFTDVVSEIELLWCFRNEKYSRKNNPTCLYYLASKESILEHETKLEEETNELFKKICSVSEAK